MHSQFSSEAIQQLHTNGRQWGTTQALRPGGPTSQWRHCWRVRCPPFSPRSALRSWTLRTTRPLKTTFFAILHSFTNPVLSQWSHSEWRSLSAVSPENEGSTLGVIASFWEYMYEPLKSCECVITEITDWLSDDQWEHSLAMLTI